jgi:N-methylhydantoinase B
VAKGDIFELHSQGGGGFGDPLERVPELVLADVVNGYVTVEAARADYGVVIEVDGEPVVNYAATDQERARRSEREVVSREDAKTAKFG